MAGTGQVGRRLLRLAVIVGLGLVVGCGIPAAHRTDYATTADFGGNVVHVDDIRAIVDDTELSTDEMREALADLGIEDEDLIDALFTLP